MANVYYKGFNSENWVNNGVSFTSTDIELVKKDLMNHIYTRPGERVHMPSFGTRIPDLVFEPEDAETVEIIREDLKTVFDYDPRVEVIDMDVVALADYNAIVAFVTLKFIELNVVDNLQIEVVSA